MSSERDPDPACIFCRIVRGEIPAKRVHEDASTVAFADLNPKAPVHVLVVPKVHIPTLADLTAADGPLVGQMVLAANQVARASGLDQRGYRLVWNCREEAGQSVFHLHLHVLGGRSMKWPPG